jgi:hypothetical protein
MRAKDPRVRHTSDTSAERSRSLIRMLTEASERGANFLEYFFQI